MAVRAVQRFGVGLEENGRTFRDTGMSGETDGEIRGAGSRNSAGNETRIGVLRK